MPRPTPPDARDRARRLVAPLTVDDPDHAVATPEDERVSGSLHPPAAPWSPVLPARAPARFADSPDPPADGAGAGRLSDAGAGETDADDVAARFRAGAMGAVASAYTTAHGHPVGADLDEPAGPRRWAVTVRTAALVLAVVLAVGAAVVTVAVSRGAGAPAARVAVEVSTPRASGGVARPSATPEPADASAAPSGTGDGATILVHVVGAVRHPGLVHLASGARLEDAVEAAGGATSSARLDAVNLASVVADGQQVRVPRKGETAAPAAASGASGDGSATGDGDASPAASSGTPVDLNTADAAALDALPGIGPVLAQRIVDHRTQNGPFTSVDQLDEVSGIGPALMGRLRDLVRV
ncbi:hypothetical protein GCM10025864_32660 [Luteimicrobium album]|uniref:Helix-hairpin-helix DNA-binding motif class 1 domain-containing protein n=1 Tax=Luteimicrobium album TaxID=1054550 RepID=A0ABQ6I4V7_9MICO|nr:helix-hairpin-helix domain-containing protein [Luteimicrobium album]GMA25507.1 hypothetical protein GCM10025864_32660 [Luteimicrobium album]